MAHLRYTTLINTFVTAICLLLNCIQPTAAEYTPEERNAIDQVRNTLGDILYQDYMKTDEYLLPWLTSRRMNVDAAIEMIKKAHKWRIENQMDTILDDKETAKCDIYYPTHRDAVDREGRPIAIINLGEWDVRKHVIAGRQEQFVRCCFRLVEIMNAKVRKIQETRKNVTQWIFMTDLKGYNLRQHACVGCFSSYVSTIVAYEANYPLAISKLIVINTPSFFEALLQIAKSVMSEDTKNALVVYGFNQGEWKSALLRDIDPDQLSTVHGGTRKHKPGTG